MALVGGAGRRFRDCLAAQAEATRALDWLTMRLTLGGLAHLRRLFPTQALRLLCPRPEIPEDAEPVRLYALPGTTPAELRLSNQLTQRREARTVARWLAGTQVEVRQVRSPTALPGMTLVHGEGAPLRCIVGNPEITAECLAAGETMAEAGLTTAVPEDAAALGAAFGRWWSQGRDVKAELLRKLELYWHANSPREIYFLALWHLFRDRLETWDGTLADDRRLVETPIWRALFPFQAHGALAALRMLEREGGCVLADSVGLGKTYTALAVVKAYERRGKRVLVLCPKKLCPNWERFLSETRHNPFRNAHDEPDFRYDLLAHTDLRPGRWVPFGRGGSLPIEEVAEKGFGLVVIDESHAFRNAGGQRYRLLLERFLRPHPETRVLLLSATPVNNRLADLTHQLALILRADLTDSAPPETRRLAEATLRRAQRAANGWNKAQAAGTAKGPLAEALPKDYFELLARFTIARNRKGITRFYANAARDIGAFPKRELRSEYPPLDAAEQRSDIAALSERLNRLSLAAYNPAAYASISRRTEGNLSDETRQRALVALMRMNALKRLESSAHAFRATLRDALLTRTLRQVKALGCGHVLVPKVTAESLELDDFDPEPEADAEMRQLPAYFFDSLRLQRALADDYAILADLLQAADALTPERDGKLQRLLTLLRGKVAAPFNPGNRKAIVFTAFADTADYLAEQLAHEPGRTVACVTGGKGRVWCPGHAPKTLRVDDLLAHFAPRAQGARPTEGDAWEIDWLVATDCLSEGQNLQDCDLVVNYDIHWNPLRLTQRAGRIDRIGSPNAVIRIVHFWPMRELDAYIGLERRVRAKDTLGALGGAGQSNLSPAEEVDLGFRMRQLEAIRLGDYREEEGLGEFRDETPDVFVAELSAWLGDRTHGADRRLACETAPLGLCAACPAELSEAFRNLGLAPPARGALFLLRRAGLSPEERAANPFGDHFLLAVDERGAPVPAGVDERDGTPLSLTPRQTLALLRGLCRDRPDPDLALDDAFAKAGPKALSPALNGALGLLGQVRESNRAKLLLGDAPFDFHSGRTEGEAALTLVLFVVVGDWAQPQKEATHD